MSRRTSGLVGVEQQLFCQHLYQFCLTYASVSTKAINMPDGGEDRSVCGPGALIALPPAGHRLYPPDDRGFQMIFSRFATMGSFVNSFSDFCVPGFRPQFDHLRQIITRHRTSSSWQLGIQANPPLALTRASSLTIGISVSSSSASFLSLPPALFPFSLHQRIIRLRLESADWCRHSQ